MYEILHRNPHVEFSNMIKNLIWLLSLGITVCLKILVVITIWTLCRHKVPFDDADKATLCDMLHHDFISLKSSGKIQAVNHILILMWLLSYDEFIQKHMLSSKYVQTFTDIFTDLTKDDTRKPDDLLNKRVVEHFPTELEGDDSDSALAYNSMHINIIKMLSVLSAHGPIGDKLIVEKFFDPLVRLITIPLQQQDWLFVAQKCYIYFVPNQATKMKYSLM